MRRCLAPFYHLRQCKEVRALAIKCERMEMNSSWLPMLPTEESRFLLFV